MKIILSVAVSLLLTSFSAYGETLNCAQLNSEIETYLHLDIDVRDSSGLGMNLVENRYFNRDLIYSKQSNSLIGFEVRELPPEPFPPFEEWIEDCRGTRFSCNEEAYEQARSLYENDPRWIRSPWEIGSDDPDYYVVDTRLKNTVGTSTPMDLTYLDTRDGYKIYQSNWTAGNRVLEILKDQGNELFIAEALEVKVNFYSSANSYWVQLKERHLVKGSFEEYPWTKSFHCNK